MESKITYLQLSALAFIGFLILLLILYVIWNALIKGRAPERTIDRDEIAFKKRNKLFEEVKKVVPSYLSVISGLTGLTFAGTIVVVVEYWNINNDWFVPFFEGDKTAVKQPPVKQPTRVESVPILGYY